MAEAIGRTRASILERSRKADAVEVGKTYLIKAGLFGHTGSGKTQSSITLPKSEEHPLLLIDYDGRAETVAGTPHVEIVSLYDSSPESPKAWDEAEYLRKELWSLARKGEFRYSGVIEDGLTMLGQVAMNSALTLDNKRGLGGAPAKQHWIPQIHTLRKHINSMRALPCHYVITGHFEILQDEDDGKLKILPKVTRSMRTELPSWFNETYYCWREKGKEGIIYYWTTGGTGKYEFFKSTLNHLGKFWEDPIQIDFDASRVGFEDLLVRRFGKEVMAQPRE